MSFYYSSQLWAIAMHSKELTKFVYYSYLKYLQARSVRNDATRWTFYLFIGTCITLYILLVYTHYIMDVWIEEVQASDLCGNVLCSDILRFADPRLKNTVWANRVNLTKGKLNVFELARSFVSAGLY
jgi:hypothetical protein